MICIKISYSYVIFLENQIVLKSDNTNYCLFFSSIKILLLDTNSVEYILAKSFTTFAITLILNYFTIFLSYLTSLEMKILFTACTYF